MKNQFYIVCSHACNKKYQYKGTGSKVAMEPLGQTADGIVRYKNAESRIEPKLQRLVNAVLLGKKALMQH